MVDLEGHQVALVHADQRGADVERTTQFALVVDLHQRIETDRQRPQRGSGPVRRPDNAAAIRSTQSAPIRRVSTTSSSLTVKSLRITGQRAGAQRRLQVGDRAAEVVDVGEHRQAAGTTRRVRTRPARPGSRSMLRSPLDGDRRLISAITPSPCASSSAERNPRVGGSVPRLGRSGRPGRDDRRRPASRWCCDDAIEIGDRHRIDRPSQRSEALAADGVGEEQLGTAGEERADRTAERLHRVAAAVAVERRLIGVLLVHPQHVGVGSGPRRGCT